MSTHVRSSIFHFFFDSSKVCNLQMKIMLNSFIVINQRIFGLAYAVFRSYGTVANALFNHSR